MAVNTAAEAQVAIQYTDINTADAVQFCTTLDASTNTEGPASASLKCPGLSGVDIYVDYYDSRDAVRVGRDGIGTPMLPPFTSFGPKAEWRLEGGVPVAMILRMQLGGSTPGNWLTVHKVDAAKKNGCIMGYVDALTNRNANLLARDLSAEAAGFICGQSQVRFAGKQSQMMVDLMDRLTIASAAPAKRDTTDRDQASSSTTTQRATPSASSMPRLDRGSIAKADCRPAEKLKVVGAVATEFCVVEELINLHVYRAPGQVIVGLGSLPEPVRSFPFPTVVDEDVGILVTEGGGVWGGIVTYTVTPQPGDTFRGWALVLPEQNGTKSCAVMYGQGEVTNAVLADLARFESSPFLPRICAKRRAIWSGSSTEDFNMMMRLMNVEFAA
ncbi:MAG: hypothetical protein AAFO73_05200 [Pseudomonadota bacterium]